MDDRKIAAIARRYVWAADEPGPPDDDPSNYYTAGPTSSDILEELRDAVNAEARDADEETAKAFDQARTDWTAANEAEQEARLPPISLPF